MSKTSIADSEEYKEFELRHNRHLNMVQDSDRNLRKQALNEFKKAIKNTKDDAILQFFYRERLCKRMVLCLEDAVEKHREIAIEIITEMVNRFGFKDESQIIIPAISNRMIKLPYAENSEEVRVQLIELLSISLEKDPLQFLGHGGAICSMLSKAGQDPNPEMKNTVAKFASKLALALDKKVGSYFKGTVDTLIGNLQHQHSKVRKQTLLGLKDVMAAAGAEAFLDGQNILQLKFTMNDRSQDVRAVFYDVLFHWMKNIELHYLKIYEPQFVQFLLNGISDDKLDIGSKCIGFLEEHSKRMREALKALGEDEEETENKNAEVDEKMMEENVKINKSEPHIQNLMNVNPLHKEDTDMISAAADYIKSKRGTAMEDID